MKHIKEYFREAAQSRAGSNLTTRGTQYPFFHPSISPLVKSTIDFKKTIIFSGLG